MGLIKFTRRRKRRSRRRGTDPRVLLALAVVGVMAVAWSAGERSLVSDAATSVRPAMAAALPAERRVRFEMCGRDRHTCVVDGDTIWLDGVNLRLQGYDTPEPYTAICGGQAEVALAKKASDRLLELLNSNPFTVETFGQDRYGRTLATIRIGGRDVGDILIAEGLARSWPDGREFWC